MRKSSGYCNQAMDTEATTVDLLVSRGVLIKRYTFITFRCKDCRRKGLRRVEQLGEAVGKFVSPSERVVERWAWRSVYWPRGGGRKGRGRLLWLREHLAVAAGLGPGWEDPRPVVLSCRVRGHGSRAVPPEWIVSRAEKALAGGYDTVHV